MDINRKLASELGVLPKQVDAAVKLIDEGNTIPFIARYRKEATGALSDEILRNLYERLNYLRNLEDKKASVLASIEEQGKLTEELRAQILAAETQVVVDDLYRPYRPKRRTRATIAKEKGLEPLGRSDLFAGDRSAVRGDCRRLCKFREGSGYGAGCDRGSHGYSGRDHRRPGGLSYAYPWADREKGTYHIKCQG